MNNAGKNRLWQELRDAQLVSATSPPASSASAPWFVRVILGIAGWIGALFLLGFVGAAFAIVLKSAAASLLVGVLCCVGAYFIFRAAAENIFVGQFGLALGLAGQALFIFGLYEQFQHATLTFYLLVLLFETVLTLLLPNFIHRLLTSWGALAALALALAQLELGSLLPGVIAAAFAVLWLGELRWAAHGAILRPLGYSLTLILLQLQSLLLPHRGDWLLREFTPHLNRVPWLGKALCAATLLAVAIKLLCDEGIALTSRAGATLLAVTALAMLVSFPATGVATALLILIIGYAGGNRLLVGLGICAFAGFLSYFYYQLQSTLLSKSLLLVASGAALLLIRLATRKAFPLRKEGSDA